MTMNTKHDVPIFAVAVVAALVSLVLWGGILYVAVHFIAKHW